MARLHRVQTTPLKLLVDLSGRGLNCSLDAVFGRTGASDLNADTRIRVLRSGQIVF